MGNSPLAGCSATISELMGEGYVKGESLGAGKFSTVYLCWKRAAPQKKYAMKVISLEDPAMQQRVQQEMDIMTRVGHHPFLLSMVDHRISEKEASIVVELCEGGELYDRIQQMRRVAEQEAKVLLRNLLEAVAFMHSKGVMHRDLKPENILLTRRDSVVDVKISDFGLAKAAPGSGRIPRSASLCGSDYYLAPEMIKQTEYGPEVDMWALGVIAYVCLSGSLPFFHQALHKLYRQIVERDMQFPPQQWAGVSRGAQDFVSRLLTISPKDRMTAVDALQHPWLRGVVSPLGGFPSMAPPSLLDDALPPSTPADERAAARPAGSPPQLPSSLVARAPPAADTTPLGRLSSMLQDGVSQLTALASDVIAPAKQPAHQSYAPPTRQGAAQAPLIPQPLDAPLAAPAPHPLEHAHHVGSAKLHPTHTHPALPGYPATGPLDSPPPQFRPLPPTQQLGGGRSTGSAPQAPGGASLRPSHLGGHRLTAMSTMSDGGDAAAAGSPLQIAGGMPSKLGVAAGGAGGMPGFAPMGMGSQILRQTAPQTADRLTTSGMTHHVHGAAAWN